MMIEKNEEIVVRTVKSGSKRRRKRKLVEYDKARLHPPEPGMMEEKMLRWGPLCKDCHKDILDRYAHVINVDGYILSGDA